MLRLLTITNILPATLSAVPLAGYKQTAHPRRIMHVEAAHCSCCMLLRCRGLRSGAATFESCDMGFQPMLLAHLPDAAQI
eukprot:SAG31_NODE_4364_length_3308_cov_1.969773_3_plen_80_part_00